MTGFVTLMLVAVAVWLVLVGGAVWAAARALRRLRRRLGAAVDRGAISVRAHALVPGPARPAAAARLELRAGIDRTRRVLDDAGRRNCPLGEVPGLFRRLEVLAESVDAELRILEGERAAVPPGRLAAVRSRSQAVLTTAAEIRRTVGDIYADLDADAYRSLRHDVDLELSALRAGVDAVRGAGAQVSLSMGPRGPRRAYHS